MSKKILVLAHDEYTLFASKLNKSKNHKEYCSFISIDDGDVIRVHKNGNLHGVIVYNQNNILDEIRNNEIVVVISSDSAVAYFGKESIDIMITPSQENLFSRVKGLYETDVISEKKVLLIGLGSGNSPTALELVKQGITKFVLMDFDRLELSNLSRHVCGMSDIGRYKTKAVADLLKNKNPYVEVTTYEMDITETTNSFRNKLIEDIDLVICGTDNRKSRLIINRLCVEHDIPCIYGGAFRRAYGGQVLHVIPHKTMCYQCFIQSLPEIAEDYEISNRNQVNEIAYSDIDNVPIEPGLSTDILPISTLVSKLAILDLLKGKEHSLHSLYDDLKPSLYIWFNRREPNTQWNEYLKPCLNNMSDMTVLRWYGIDSERLPNCPVCGTFNPLID